MTTSEAALIPAQNSLRFRLLGIESNHMWQHQSYRLPMNNPEMSS